MLSILSDFFAIATFQDMRDVTPTPSHPKKRTWQVERDIARADARKRAKAVQRPNWY